MSAATGYGGAPRPTIEDPGGENYAGSRRLGSIRVVLLQPLTLRKGDSLQLGLTAGDHHAVLRVNHQDIYLAPRRWQPGPLGRWYFDVDWKPWSLKFSDGRGWDESKFGWRNLRGWDVSLPRARQITIFASTMDLLLLGGMALASVTVLAAWLLT